MKKSQTHGQLHGQLFQDGEETEYKFASLKEIEDRGLVLMYPRTTETIKPSQLTKVMKDKSISQYELATLINVQRGTLNQWLLSPKQMPLDIALKIAYILDTPMEELFPLSPEMWSISFPFNEKRELFLDLSTMTMVTSNAYYRGAKGKQWYDTRTQDILTNKERREREIAYVAEHLEDQTDSYESKIRKHVLKEDFAKLVVPRFAKVVKPVNPFKI